MGWVSPRALPTSLLASLCAVALTAGAATVAVRSAGETPPPAAATGPSRSPSVAAVAPSPSDQPRVVRTPSPRPSAAAPRPAPTPAPTRAPARKPVRVDRLAPLRGLSVWIDVYDYKTGTGAAAAARLVDQAAAGGAQSVWIEPSRWNTAAIWAPIELGAMLDRAEARGLHAVLWTLPGFASVADDEAHALAAVRFRGPRGGRADALALDIEVDQNAEDAVRVERLLELTRRLRRTLSMPLVAITPNPVGMARNPSYWPGFPFRSLSRMVDAISPMGYWSFRKDDPVAYTRAVVRGVQSAVGSTTFPIHLIGGLAEDTTAAQWRAYCAYARATRGVIGAGAYDLTSHRLDAFAGLAGCRAVGR